MNRNSLITIFSCIMILVCLIGLIGAIPPNINGIPNSTSTFNVNTSSSGNASVLTGTSGQNIYVTSIVIMANGTTNVSLVYGTTSSTPCDTGTTTLVGPMPLIAQTGWAHGVGSGAVYVVPSGNDLCIDNGSAVAIGGAVSTAKF